MVVAHTDKDHRKETTRQGSPDGFQQSPSLAEDNHRPRKNLLKFTLFDISMARLVVRFSCSFVIGKSDPHGVPTCIYNSGALSERQVCHRKALKLERGTLAEGVVGRSGSVEERVGKTGRGIGEKSGVTSHSGKALRGLEERAAAKKVNKVCLTLLPRRPGTARLCQRHRGA